MTARHVGLAGAVAAEGALAGVRVAVHARDLGSGAEVGVGSDEPVVLASVFKIAVAVELARQFEAGGLDPTERVRVPAAGRTIGDTGLSALLDEVELSLRDLAQLMMSVSDNAATDVVLRRVGLDRVNATLRALGLEQTVLEGDCAFLLGRMGHELHAASTTRSTPREMVRLLDLVWRDEAGPPGACAFVRRIMGQQVWPHRLRTGFPDGVKCSGKTGTLPFVRNEAGVVEYPDGDRYAVAVFTVSGTPLMVQPDADRAIGRVARLTVDALRVRLHSLSDDPDD